MRIVAQDLTYTYNAKSPFASQALCGVTLTLEEGEFFGIIGHTGSGKSTFVQHLNALIRLTGGSLKVGEYDLADKSANFWNCAAKWAWCSNIPNINCLRKRWKRTSCSG